MKDQKITFTVTISKKDFKAMTFKRRARLEDVIDNATGVALHAFEGALAEFPELEVIPE